MVIKQNWNIDLAWPKEGRLLGWRRRFERCVSGCWSLCGASDGAISRDGMEVRVGFVAAVETAAGIWTADM